jgi:hypothetical protein
MASIASDEDVFAQFKEESWKQYVRMWYQFIWEFRVTYTKHKSVWCVRSNTAKDVFREMGIPRLTITQASGLAHDKHTQVTRYNETTKDRGIQSKLAANELVFWQEAELESDSDSEHQEMLRQENKEVVERGNEVLADQWKEEDWKTFTSDSTQKIRNKNDVGLGTLPPNLFHLQSGLLRMVLSLPFEWLAAIFAGQDGYAPGALVPLQWLFRYKDGPAGLCIHRCVAGHVQWGQLKNVP